MSRLPLACVRLIAYSCSLIAFVIFACHLMIQTNMNVHTDTADLLGDFHIRAERDVLEYDEPKVNTMCSEAKDVYLLILINTAPHNFYLRWTIRKTWGSLRQHKGLNIRLAFIIGQLPEDDWRTRKLIDKESQETNDLIIGDFYDSYYNLTAKTLFGMNWVRRYCSNAQYIVKGDDDVLIIPQHIIDYLQELPKEKTELLYEGACQVHHGPMRGDGNKWYISEQDYPNSTYPPYQLGITVLHSYKALEFLYDACHRVPDELDIPINFPFDDVFIGICAHLTPIEVTCNNHIIVYKDYELKKFLRSRRPNCLMATTLAVHGLNRRRVVERRWRMVTRLHRDGFDNCTFNYTTTPS